MLEWGRHVSSGALLRFAQSHIITAMNEWLHYQTIFFLLLGPFPTRTRCYHRSRFHDQDSGNQRGEGQGTWRTPWLDIARSCTDEQSLTANMMFFQLQIWDTAGQERFRSITQSYYRSANALILTYDITCEDSFRCLPEWLREIEQYANNQVVTILVGKKLDFALWYPPAAFRRAFWLDKRHLFARSMTAFGLLTLCKTD